MKTKLAVVLSAVSFMTACAITPKVDPSLFVKDQSEKIEVPKICKDAYESAIPKIAITEISNNTSFDYAKTVEAHVSGSSSRQSAGGAAAVVAPGAGAVAWGASERKQFKAEASVIARNINAKLSESVRDSISDELVNLGGLKLYARADLDKIIKEQKLQRSGLFDDKQLVRLGKLSGARYVMTGSISNVNLSYLSLQRIHDASSKNSNNLLTALITTALDSNEGWRVETEVNVRMLDAETGEMVLSKKVTGKEIIGKMPYPKYDVLIGSIKRAVTKGLTDLRPEFSKYFTVKGYVMQTKSSPEGNDKIALVNIGENQKIKPGTTLYAYVFEEVQDPMTGKIVCDQQKLPVELCISDQIQGDKSWCSIKCDPKYLKYIKPGQLVERAPMKGQSIIEKFGY